MKIELFCVIITIIELCTCVILNICFIIYARSERKTHLMIKIAVIGFGNIGNGFVELIESNKELIKKDCGTEVEIKYRGYIQRERELAERMVRLENIKIKNRFDYNNIESLSTEARQKLTAINPETLAQASRIPGVSPSDINVLLVLVRK